MAFICDSLPDVVLAIMGLLGLVSVRRFNDAFAAAAALFGVEEEELYRQVELFVEDRWDEFLAALDVHGRGRQYFVGEAAERRPNPLLLEAACRLMKAQLTILDLERHSADLFGHDGRMYTAAIEGGQFVALIGQPLVPWHQDVAHELEPGSSHEGKDAPRIVLPVQVAPKEVVPQPEAGLRVVPEEVRMTPQKRGSEEVERDAAEESGEGRMEPVEVDRNERAEWQEALAARYREMLRPRGGANPPGERAPRRRPARVQPEFRPADVSALPPHMTAELAAPVTPPYVVRNNKILCRLAHCGVPNREFETVAAWKKHVALARSHLEDAFCGTCGHHLIVPPGTAAGSIKALITAHKEERCIGASKLVLRQRRANIAWLESLMRNTSHILVPDMHQEEAAAEPEQQSSVAGRKRRYDTEEARRADICAAYLKRFKTTEPNLMAEIASEYQLRLP